MWQCSVWEMAWTDCTTRCWRGVRGGRHGESSDWSRLLFLSPHQQCQLVSDWKRSVHSDPQSSSDCDAEGRKTVMEVRLSGRLWLGKMRYRLRACNFKQEWAWVGSSWSHRFWVCVYMKCFSYVCKEQNVNWVNFSTTLKCLDISTDPMFLRKKAIQVFCYF